MRARRYKCGRRVARAAEHEDQDAGAQRKDGGRDGEVVADTGAGAGGGAAEREGTAAEAVAAVEGDGIRRSGWAGCCMTAGGGQQGERLAAVGGMLAWVGRVACNPRLATTWWRHVRQAASQAATAWFASGPGNSAGQKCCCRRPRAAATTSGPGVGNIGPLREREREAGLSIYTNKTSEGEQKAAGATTASGCS